jgi:hypothetical protein
MHCCGGSQKPKNEEHENLDEIKKKNEKKKKMIKSNEMTGCGCHGGH